jgi:hypothetical protein
MRINKLSLVIPALLINYINSSNSAKTASTKVCASLKSAALD